MFLQCDQAHKWHVDQFQSLSYGGLKGSDVVMLLLAISKPRVGSDISKLHQICVCVDVVTHILLLCSSHGGEV